MQLHRISYVFVPIAIVVLFASVLTGEERLAFRDVSHFYTPLYEYVASRTSDHWLPLWNPLDQTGLPLVGETTTAVLYPVRWAVFSLPLPAAQAMGWYVALHLILASITATWTARVAGISRHSASIAGITYTMSGSVLFLHTNPSFLVGAAWLPILFATLVCGDSLRTRVRILFAGLAMTMMILGGDPQAALHGMLIAAAVYVLRSARLLLLRNGPMDFRPGAGLVAMIGSVVLASMLAAPQLAASLSWSKHSGRVVQDSNGKQGDDWTAPPVVGTKRHDAYQFSLAPWHAAEIITPNAWGSLFPINHRISQAIAGDGRMWTPSIYMGVLAAIALLLRIFRVRRDGIDAWAGIAAAGLLLSFGHFGGAWVAQQIPGVLAGWDSAIGGPYWCLHQWLPGYDAFRYPAKWLPVFSLATAILTARCVDDISLSSIRLPGLRFAAITIGLAVLASLIATSIWIGDPPNWLAKLGGAADEYWGATDFTAGIQEVRWSLVHTLTVLASVAVVFRLLQSKRITVAWGCLLLSMILCVEMGLAAASSIATLSVQAEAKVLADADYENDTSGDYWMRSGRIADPNWSRSYSADRIQQVGEAERLSGFGRWNLNRNRRTFNSMTSIRSRHIDDLWQVMNQRTEDASDDSDQWQRIQDWLGITATTGNAAAYRTAPIWTLVDQNSMSMEDVIERVVDQNAEPVLMKPSELASDVPAWRDESSQRTIEIELDREALLYQSVYQDGNWYAGLTNHDTGEHVWGSVYQVDLIKQGVIVPAGRWQVDFYYAPRWVALSLVASFAGVFTCLILIALTVRNSEADHVVPDPVASASYLRHRAR